LRGLDFKIFRYHGSSVCILSRLGEDNNMSETYICSECREVCEIIEETFDYSGTHCTNGKGGIHHTGYYTSKCCDAEFEIDPYYEEEDDE